MKKFTNKQMKFMKTKIENAYIKGFADGGFKHYMRTTQEFSKLKAEIERLSKHIDEHTKAKYN